MYTELLKNKIFEQSWVYQAVKGGDPSSVQYRASHDPQWGTSDGNYIGRMRLAYYLLYAGIDDEDVTAFLFREELKDRKSNSFQGIGDALNVLTALIGRYNGGGRYDALLGEAKNANFDCACGYDKNYRMDDDINSLDLMDCIFLSRTLGYKDVMEQLVEQWKGTVAVWTDEARTSLIEFNSFLGKERENEAIYQELLSHVVSSGDSLRIISTYNRIIRYYIDMGQFETAYVCLRKMIDTTNLKEIEGIQLFNKILEASFEIVCGGIAERFELWQWAKPHLQRRKNRYGNLYKKAIAAASCVGDPYAARLEEEYADWKKEMGLG